MKRKMFLMIPSALMLAVIAPCQTQPGKAVAPSPPAAATLVDSLVQRLSNELRAKTVAGEPIKMGTVTLIPILMLDVNFGGASLAAPTGSTGNPPAGPVQGGDGFLMSGEARPVGFVAITKKGVEFMSLAEPRK